MNWSLAITHNQALLMRFLTMLIGMAGMRDGEASVLPRALYAEILRLLRPAESALRRLIVIAARELLVPQRKVGALAPRHLVAVRSVGKARSPASIPAFPLFDRRVRVGDDARSLRFTRFEPRIRGFDGFEDFDAPATSHQPIDAGPLSRRLIRFQRALGDVKREARRLALWRARHKDDLRRPMRPGRPPGHRARPYHGIDHILRELHQLALLACAPPETLKPAPA